MAELNELVHEYLRNKELSDALLAKNEELKASIAAAVPQVPGTKVDTQYGSVEYIKGRHIEKLDQKVLKKNLVLKGVDLDIIDLAFTASTVVTDGKPSVRVTGKTIEEEKK